MLSLNNPIDHEGKTYDKAVIMLAISPVNKGGNYSAAVSMTIKPFRKDASGNIEELEEHDKYVIIADIDQTMLTDSSLQSSVAGILQSLQSYLNAKGI
jgi:hypothetical protein